MGVTKMGVVGTKMVNVPPARGLKHVPSPMI